MERGDPFRAAIWLCAERAAASVVPIAAGAGGDAFGLFYSARTRKVSCLQGKRLAPAHAVCAHAGKAHARAAHAASNGDAHTNIHCPTRGTCRTAQRHQ